MDEDSSDTVSPVSSSTTQPSSTTRTSLACLSCRHLKIRCIREANKSDLCENCSKSGRLCQFVPQTRTRRRKRMDVRLGELEHKVVTLTAQLKQDARSEEGMMTSNGSRIVKSNQDIDSHQRMHTQQSGNSSTSEGPDIIDQDLLSWIDGKQLFNRYKTELASCYPIVPLSDETEAMSFRRKYPTLFLAMITAAAATSSEDIQNLLYATTVKTFASLIMIDGKKSLEILQALLITVAWYRPCSTFGGDTKYFQYSQFASLMAHELQLDRVSSEKGNNDAQHGVSEMKETQALQVAAQRTLLASYLQASSKELMSGANFMALPPASVTASLTYLELNIFDFSIEDRCLFSYVRVQYTTQQALEMLYNKNSFLDQFQCDEDSVVSILRVYGKQLEDIVELGQTTVCNMTDFLRIAGYAAILRLYEVVLYREYDSRDFRAPFILDTTPKSSSYNIQSAYLELVRKCITTAGKLLDILSSLDLVLAVAMPPVIFVRMMYAFVVLFKIHQIVESPAHTLSAVVQVDELRLSSHLQKLHQMLSDIDRHSSFHGFNKFLVFVEDMQTRVAAIPV